MSTATPEKIVLTKLIDGETYYSQLSFNLIKSMMDDLQKENQKMREALEELTKPIDKDSRLNMDDIAECFKEIRQKFNLSETTNKEIEG